MLKQLIKRNYHTVKIFHGQEGRLRILEAIGVINFDPTFLFFNPVLKYLIGQRSPPWVRGAGM